MCGIVGFTGSVDAKDLILAGLFKLEYRGYDSAGIALIDSQEASPHIEVLCRVGKVVELASALKEAGLTGTCGIGHTRWATHGAPSERNAHPHVSCDGRLAVVHNGIIENYASLRTVLKEKGHRFVSETDTEVVAHLIEELYAGGTVEGISCAPGDMLCALRTATGFLQGAYGLAVVHADYPQDIFVTRRDSPIVVGSSMSGAFVASDTPAIIDHTRDVVYLDDGDIAVLHASGRIGFFDANGAPITREPTHIEWDPQTAERSGFPDFMLKEIHEQPRVVRDTLVGRMVDGRLYLEELVADADLFGRLDRICIIGCGTSYHAGLIAKDLIEAWTRIPVEVAVASEFHHRDPIITPDTLVIAISQSGETADTLAAVRLARAAGAKVYAITNAVGSRITRESDSVLYIKANIEISVAATKSFLAQITLLALVALYLAQERGKLTSAEVAALYADMEKLPAQIEEILADTSAIKRAAQACFKAHSVMFIGRGMGATACAEGALKLKEISYLHAEAYPAGELKHGPIALLDEHVPVVAIATESALEGKVISNIEECSARGAKVIIIATKGDETIGRYSDYVIYIPPVRDCFMPITASVPLQLFAREIALLRGCDVDHPRNLAKSVTVE
jgi:glutamine---fructose-6-phosphate transaminase (isomerizing)